MVLKLQGLQKAVIDLADAVGLTYSVVDWCKRTRSEKWESGATSAFYRFG